MSEPVFFKPARSLTLSEVIELTDARPRGDGPPGILICDVAALECAGPSDLAFAQTMGSVAALRLSHAGACLMPEQLLAAAPARMLALGVDDPYDAFIKVAAALYPESFRPSSLFDGRRTSAGALVHPTARLEPGITIDPMAVIGPHAEIGTGTLIGPMAVIGPAVRIGRDCAIGAGCSLTNALIGDRVIIYPGCRVGQIGLIRGAGAAPIKGSAQVGRVILQDNVEIGANCVIDRGHYRDTVLGEGSVIDSLVHIASGSMIGRHCRIVGQQELQPIERGLSSPIGENSGDFTIVDGTETSAATVGRCMRAT